MNLPFSQLSLFPPVQAITNTSGLVLSRVGEPRGNAEAHDVGAALDAGDQGHDAAIALLEIKEKDNPAYGYGITVVKAVLGQVKDAGGVQLYRLSGGL